MDRSTETDIPQPPLTTARNDSSPDYTPLPSTNSPSLDKVEILRQVEHYFSDGNLAGDAHLLGKLQEGNGMVSVKHILGFPRMRRYKPASAVREILKGSAVIEIIDNKYIKRRRPFDMANAKVEAQINQDEETAKKKAALGANPHLTKNMLKRTGFEHDHVEPELSAEEQQAELDQYSTEHPIYERVETAVLRYKMNRKLHQQTARVFHAFLRFGGFDERPSGFTGGTSKAEEETLSKEEKARRKQVSFVSNDVIRSFDDEDGEWIVDFEGVTKGFFSTAFPKSFLSGDGLQHDKDVTQAACNVLRNFFNYLLYHNVCAEYTEQIHSARDALEAIEHEYLEMAAVQRVFPGVFNIACSTLFDGHYAKIRYQGDWMTPEEAESTQKGLNDTEAQAIVNAGVAAFASLEQIGTMTSDIHLEPVSTEHDLALEVIEIVPGRYTSPESQELFSKLSKTVVPSMGKLICNRYHFPDEPPLDLPLDLPPSVNKYVVLMDDDTLQKCYVGLKFKATVKELNVGLYYIDHWTQCYGTFYTWCWNEKARKVKAYNDLFKLHKPEEHEPEDDALFVVSLMKEKRLLENTPAAEQCDTTLDATESSHGRIEFTRQDSYEIDEESTIEVSNPVEQPVDMENEDKNKDRAHDHMVSMRAHASGHHHSV